jgi:toxin-antitoxin system PIN domain toxin
LNAPDTNLLIYAYNQTSPFHTKAKAYWQDALSKHEPIGIPIVCIHGFIRVATGPALGTSRLGPNEALDIVESWQARPNVRILHPGQDHWRILRNLARQTNAAGALFTDVAIAAIAIEHGAVVHTNDRDFARFPGVRWHNPLTP